MKNIAKVLVLTLVVYLFASFGVIDVQAASTSSDAKLGGKGTGKIYKYTKLEDFIDDVEKGSISVAGSVSQTSEGTKTKEYIEITANADGCLLIAPQQDKKSSLYFKVFDVTSKVTSSNFRSTYGNLVDTASCYSGDNYSYFYYPMSKGDIIRLYAPYVSTAKESDKASVYLGYVNFNSAIKSMTATRLSTGNYQVKMTVANGVKTTVGYPNGNVTTNLNYMSNSSYLRKDIISPNDALWFNDCESSSYIEPIFSSGKSFIVIRQQVKTPETSIKLGENGLVIDFLMTMNPTDYVGKATVTETTSDLKVISALVGTNVVVGYGPASKVIYVEYNGKTYKAKSKADGLFRIKVASLKKGKSVKVYQSGQKSSAITVKVQLT